jgi:hypothetical protein
MKNWFPTVLMVPILITVIAIAGIVGTMKYNETQRAEIKKYHWYADRLTFVNFSSRLLCCKGDISVKASRGDFYKVGNIFYGKWIVKNKTATTITLDVQEMWVSSDFKPFAHYQVHGKKQLVLLPQAEEIIVVVGYLDPIVLTYDMDVANPPRGRNMLFRLILQDPGLDERFSIEELDDVKEYGTIYGDHRYPPR